MSGVENSNLVIARGCIMPVKKLLSIFVLSVGALCLVANGRADDKDKDKVKEKKADTPLMEMDSEIAQQYGAGIYEKFAKENKTPQIKYEPDTDKAVGLFNPGSNEGIIAIPVKGWKEDRENKLADTETGVPMCFVCMSQTYNPLIDGKPIDAKKLRKVKFGEGEREREATCLLCSVKHGDGDDWQLYVYGADKEPLIKAPWGEASDAPKGGLAITIQDPTKDQATLVFNIFEKYATSITIGHKHK
jgi:hypothetical protein